MELGAVIDGIIAKSNGSIKAEQDDYIDEATDLLMCGKCGTPKQCQVEILGRTRTPMCLCKCQAEKREREEEERKRIEFEKRVKRMRLEGFPEAKMQTWTFANDDLANERITKAMQRYVDNFAELRKIGKGLLLYGSIGTGKTYAACEVANALIDKGYPVYVTNFSRVLNTLQGTFDKQEYIDELNRYQLLILDDLGIERETAFAKEQVFNVIDARYRAGLPVIITTNLAIDNIKSPDNIGDSRIYDRILERCFPIEVTGQSRRRKAVINEYDDMRNLLGL
jgi:DNA replication protein DnaC